jgi:hypothetical protein
VALNLPKHGWAVTSEAATLRLWPLTGPQRAMR